MNDTILYLVLALVSNDLLHNMLEIHNIREKVRRLGAYMTKKPYKELPINIDTRAKSYALSFAAFIIPTTLLFILFSLFKPSLNVALYIMLTLLIANYFISAILIDKYHVEIEQITKKFKK